MKISQIFNLGVSHKQLDFIDIDIKVDYPLFLDPFLISRTENQFSAEVNETVKNFFSKIIHLILENNYEEALNLFQFMKEPKETCLGLSKTGTENGRGVGKYDAKEILNGIIRSKAIENGLVKNIEDVIIFVEDVYKDKLSDMITNIIRGHLLDYTNQQCEIWGIPTTTKESLPFWDKTINDWNNKITSHLVIGNKDILLIPKYFVSFINLYSSDKFDWFYAVEQNRQEHLERRSELVKFRKYRNGKEKYTCSKKDVSKNIQDKVKNGTFESRKDFLRQFAISHDKIFNQFIEDCKNKITILTDEEFDKYLGSVNIENIIDELISQLQSIPTGTAHATEYHLFIKKILELLFYPFVINPTIENKIHDGRKRIDITMTNNANYGFFYNLHTITKIFAPYIFIECKNYGNEIGNPEIDQLSGRFSTYRGSFGILMCRNVKDEDRLIKRCQDTHKDGRGLIIPLLDKDIIVILKEIQNGNTNIINEYLEDIKKRIILS